MERPRVVVSTHSYGSPSPRSREPGFGRKGPVHGSGETFDPCYCPFHFVSLVPDRDVLVLYLLTAIIMFLFIVTIFDRKRHVTHKCY